MKKSILLLLSLILLTACGANWVVPVDLKPEDRAKYEKQLAENQETIDTYKPKSDKDPKNAPFDAYMDLALAQTNLGLLGDAVNTYTKADKLYAGSRALHNNRGRIYEQVGEYDKAIEDYKYLVEKLNESNYLYDITWAYIKSKNRRDAEKYFNAWQQAVKHTDEYTQKAIKQLREEENKTS